MSDPNSLNAYSLWLEPELASRKELARIIEEGAKITPTSFSFAPHITLFPSIQLSEPLENIQRRLETGISRFENVQSAIQLQLQKPTFGKTYYQSVLSPIRPTTQLAALRKMCCDIWGEHPDFFPHLSLKYGDIQESRRQEIAHIISKGGDLPTEITIREISIARCVGMANEWTVVKRVPFSTS